MVLDKFRLKIRPPLVEYDDLAPLAAAALDHADAGVDGGAEEGQGADVAERAPFPFLGLS